MRFALTCLLGLTGCAGLAAQTQAGPALADQGAVTGSVYSANKRAPGRRDGGSVQRVDIQTGELAAKVDTCENPHEMAASPDLQYLAVACFSDTHIEIYRADTLEPVTSIDLGENARPHDVVWRHADRIVATAQGRGTIFAVENPLADTPLVREIGTPIENGPHMVVVSEDGKTAWGAANFDSVVIAYDLEAGQEIARKQLAGFTEAITLTPGDASLFLAAARDDNLYRLDPATLEIVAETPVGDAPVRIISDPAGQYVVTSNRDAGSISVVDTATNTLVRTIEVSGSSYPFQIGIGFSADGSRLYVSEIEGNSVTEVDFASGVVLRQFRSESGPDGLTVTP